MRNLNLDQLQTLLVVAETRSFSAAARRLNLTQPAVSVQVRELERRFGVKLIERLGKQAHLTPPGRELVDAAQRILRECDRTTVLMRQYRDGWVGRVRIGTTNTALMYLLPPLLRRLSLDHAGIELHVTNLPTRDSVEAILRNTIDLALVTLPVDQAQLLVTPLRRDRMLAIFPAGRPDIPDVVTPNFVLSQAVLMEHTRAAVHDLVMQWLAGHEGQPRVPMHLGTIEAVKSAVASNLGMSIIPEMALSGRESEIVSRPLAPPLERRLGLIEHRGKLADSAFRIVRDTLLELCDVPAAATIEPSQRSRLSDASKRRKSGSRTA